MIFYPINYLIWHWVFKGRLLIYFVKLFDSYKKMAKTSFKTHDPFVILELLDGNTNMHASSLILCSILIFRDEAQGVDVIFKETLILIAAANFVSIIC
jgi:hypothetical protein